MGKHVLKSTPLTLHHTWESSPDTPFLIFTRRKNVIDVYRERRKENQLKELFSIAPFFSITQLFARLTTPRELTCKSTCFKVNLEARKRVFTYIFIVPLGPRFVLRTSWRPLAAVMLRCKAAADLATSAFGFSALIAAMLVCQSSRTFQPFSLVHMHPSQCPFNSGNATIPRDSAPEVLPVIAWLQSNLPTVYFFCMMSSFGLHFLSLLFILCWAGWFAPEQYPVPFRSGLRIFKQRVQV